jgi:hypothetical protein
MRRAFVIMKMNLEVSLAGIEFLADWLLATQEGQCTIELVG